MSYFCENCGKEFTEDYRVHKDLNTARFCSSFCCRQFNGKKNKGVVGHPNYNVLAKEKVAIDEKCPHCGKNFYELSSFRSHKSQCPLNPDRIEKKNLGLLTKSDKWKEAMSNRRGVPQNHNPEGLTYYCSFCGRSFSRKESKTLHEKYCAFNPDKVESPSKGKKHSSEQNKKNRLAVIRRYEKLGLTFCPNISIKGCQYIDNLNKQNGWNLQHGLNGGEVEIDGYYPDGYDKERNIVFEYDEPLHYVDVEKNILTEKDLKRQAYLIEKLNCKFYRYNEKKDHFYEVN